MNSRVLTYLLMFCLMQACGGGVDFSKNSSQGAVEPKDVELPQPGAPDETLVPVPPTTIEKVVTLPVESQNQSL